jgi:transaldolase
MKPEGLRTKIFIDGGDPGETREIMHLLGFLDGQTTNPSLISKNPKARELMEKGEKFSKEEALGFYREVVMEISGLLPHGAISVEVYADGSTTSEEMLKQGREMFTWIPNAHIKFPCSGEGLKAAGQAIREGLRVNMTLCFRQEQAAAVHAATKGAKRGAVFVSPFVGRLDDREENGMDLISHILRMYRKGDGHVELLTASVRKFDHLLYALKLGSDIVTVPYKILKEWGEKGLPVPGAEYLYDAGSLKEIPYEDIALDRPWQEYDIHHELTDMGMELFSRDWNSLITQAAAPSR